jgi:class 3 adenylate cyclase/CheY-like chemotaxis protein
MPNRVLIVESGVEVAQTLARFFEEREDEVWHAWKLEEAVSLLDLVEPDLMLLDIHFPGDAWLDFLSQTRDKYPDLRIMITTKQIDLQREVLAKQRGVDVFVRQPFTNRWLDLALKQISHKQPSTHHKIITQPAALPPARLPIHVKIILPFMILGIIFSLVAFYINLQVSYDLRQSYQSDHLAMLAVQGSNWMAENEVRMLSSLREMVNTQGMTAAMMRRDTSTMAAILEPLAANDHQDAVEVLDRMGNTIFSVHRSDQTYISKPAQESTFAHQHAVEMALRGISDHAGDKYTFLVKGSNGQIFYLCSPIYDDNGLPVGIILVGRTLSSLVMDMHHDLVVDVTLYDLEGRSLSTTLSPGIVQDLRKEKAQEISQNQNLAAFTRKAAANQAGRDEILVPWQVRGGDQIGLLGLSLNDLPFYWISPWLRVEAAAAVLFALLIVWLVGYRVALLFKKSIQRLLSATSEVNRGNLVTKVDISGNDELSILTHAFNSMLLGFQQNVLYRDLMGYAPSAASREKMRQTFENEGFNLRGQQIDVSILISDVHDFTSLANSMDPEKAVEILNDYFEHLAGIVVNHNGVINKLEGDAMIVIFGALPDLLPPEESAREACQAAAAMLMAIQSFNEKNVRNGLPALVTGISIHTGPVILGGLTIRDQLHYTPIGETVRTAHHLEELTSQLSNKSDIFISQDTYQLLGKVQKDYVIKNLGQYAVKEGGNFTSVYRLVPTHREFGAEDYDG